MGEFRTLEIKQSVFADNDKRADEVRKELKEMLEWAMQTSGGRKFQTRKQL